MKTIYIEGRPMMMLDDEPAWIEQALHAAREEGYGQSTRIDQYEALIILTPEHHRRWKDLDEDTAAVILTYDDTHPGMTAVTSTALTEEKLKEITRNWTDGPVLN
jgi:hypothetical protein